MPKLRRAFVASVTDVLHDPRERIVIGTDIPFDYPNPALTKIEILDASEAVKERSTVARLVAR